jgi:hypothetical protein
MFQTQGNGMQRKSLRRPPVMQSFFPAIPAIAQHRMAVVGEMNANLVATAGFQLNLDDSCIPQYFYDSIVSDCEPALALPLCGKLVQIVSGYQMGAKHTFRLFQNLGDDGNVPPLGLPLLELFP